MAQINYEEMNNYLKKFKPIISVDLFKDNALNSSQR